ncbi:hypothetical protein EJ04DRAFT_483472 [Polyplosphaeria fusca]|uniref:Uncharacterized protein n=1 Tax=Polyplosphaeria fusca TaxID=682080 RepID=A0A9P4R9Z4_9PLEO|nr:hypothetical protein EJ04DRAFT_483472 [Polyplosphaeria fusca]
MECASRGLAFFSYQATQEILYQESLARSLTEKYGNLSQQMDQLIHDANAQIKVLQDKIQAMHGEQMSLENKNEELVNAFREKSKTHNQVQQLYQRLKAQLMSNQVTDAAGEQADFALQNARADRYVDRIPGTRTGTANVSHVRGHTQRGGVRQHHKDGSGSSGSGQPRGAIQIGPAWNSQSQGSGLGARLFAGRMLFLRKSCIWSF